MKILVVGAGAVGGYFGARLAQAGRDVTFLVRPSRAQHLRSEGLRIVSPHGDLALQPQTITAKELDGPLDVIFLSVKAQALDQAIEDMAPAVGPNTMIYPALNGMRHIETLIRRFGERPILGGVCMVIADLDEQGRIVQMNPIQKLIYGERNGEITPRIRLLDEALRDSRFDTELSTSITYAMWQKWFMIASLGLVTCLLNAPIGEINAVPYGDQTALRAIEECAAVAAACGFPPSQPVLEDIRRRAITRGSNLTSSMYRDLQKGAPVEVDAILGDLLDHGRSHNVDTPLLQAGCIRLRIYQNSRQNSRPTS
ncbi:MAG TPA: ketopantoate reductase family protein [Edaphobacter sp.]|jgi:2-dehydropantoate 2-reductase|nr:ketopantoate reductase family protein [Edaphobacter sp.]